MDHDGARRPGMQGLPAHLGIRRMSVGELFDEALDSYRRRPALYFGMVALADAPLAAATALLAFLPEVWPGDAQGYRLAVRLLAGVWVAAALGRFLAGGAVASAVYQEAAGEAPTAGRCLRAVLRHGLVLVACGLVAWTAGALLLAMFVVPAFVGWVFFAYCAPVAVVEGSPFGSTLRRSFALAGNAFPRLAGAGMLFSLAVVVVVSDALLGVVFAVAIAGSSLHVEVGQLSQWLTVANLRWLVTIALGTFLLLDPLQWLLRSVAYLETRVRMEGFDLRERIRVAREAAARVREGRLGGLAGGTPR